METTISGTARGVGRPSLLGSIRAKQAEFARLVSRTPTRPAFRKKNRSAYANFLRAKYEAYTGAVEVKSYPYYLCIDPADVCQLRCPTCPTGIENERRKGPAELKFVYRNKRSILPPTLFDALLDEVGEYLFLIMFYNYGEPLLNRSLPDFIRKANARDIETEIHTNLSLPLSDAQIDDVMTSGLDYLNASIDGFSQATYEIHRVGGNLELVKRNLERFAAARDRLGAKTEITYKFLVFKHNEHEVPAARDYCQQLGIRFVYGDAFITDQTWLPSHRQNEVPYYSEEQIKRRASEWDAAGKPGYWGEHEKRTSWFPGKSKEADTPPFCGWHYGVSVVTAGGPVAPCCAASKEVDDFGTVIPGEVRFADVWNNDRVKVSRAVFAGKDRSGLEHADSVCVRCYFPKFVQQLYSIHDAKVIAQFYRQFNGSEPGLTRAFDLLTRSRYTPVERALVRRGVVHEVLMARGNEKHTGEFVEYFEQELAGEAPALPAPAVPARPPAPPSLPLRLKFGADATWTLTRSGWCQDEASTGDTLRWSEGRQSVLAVPLPGGRDICMQLDCKPLVYPGSPRQRVSVWLNGASIGELTLSPERQTYSVILPEAGIHGTALNRLELRYAYARRPRKVVPGASDTRILAVAWYSIEFAEVASEAVV